jgi:hypothetical protein
MFRGRKYPGYPKIYFTKGNGFGGQIKSGGVSIFTGSHSSLSIAMLSASNIFF